MGERKRIYIAGAMRGIPYFNFPAFDKARDELTEEGWDVVSPADLDRDKGLDVYALPSDFDWQTLDDINFDLKDAVRRDVDAIMNCDAIYMLQGWRNSKGATAELGVAKWLGLEIREQPAPIGSLVAFIGAKQAGKTTLANKLLNAFTVKMSFANPLRSMLEGLGVPRRYLVDEKTKPIPFIAGQPTARHLMQTLGTEWGRNCVHPDIWVNLAHDDFLSTRESGVNVVVDDLRFPNEAEVVRKQGGKIICIMNLNCNSGNDEHESERYWKEIEPDYTIMNDGTPEDLLQAYQQCIAANEK